MLFNFDSTYFVLSCQLHFAMLSVTEQKVSLWLWPKVCQSNNAADEKHSVISQNNTNEIISLIYLKQALNNYDYQKYWGYGLPQSRMLVDCFCLLYNATVTTVDVRQGGSRRGQAGIKGGHWATRSHVTELQCRNFACQHVWGRIGRHVGEVKKECWKDEEI